MKNLTRCKLFMDDATADHLCYHEARVVAGAADYGSSRQGYRQGGLHDLLRPFSARIYSPSYGAVMTQGYFRKFLVLLRRIVISTGVLSILVLFFDYALDVRKRITLEPACKWNEVENPKNEAYAARYCLLTKDTIVFRLYDVSGKQLLAERTYAQMDRPNISWAPGKIWYDTNPEDMYVRLPPTMLDRLRAKLP